MPQTAQIVIVDDDHAYTKRLADESAKKGIKAKTWGCRGCEDGHSPQPFEKALEVIRQAFREAKDVGGCFGVALDVNQYVNDEYSLKSIIPAIRADPELKDIVVVAYSFQIGHGLGQKALEAGANLWYDRHNTPSSVAADLIAEGLRR